MTDKPKSSPEPKACPNHTQVASDVQMTRALQEKQEKQINELFDRVRELEKISSERVATVRQLQDQTHSQSSQLLLLQTAVNNLASQVDRTQAETLGFRNGVCEAQKDIDGLSSTVGDCKDRVTVQEQQLGGLSEKLTERTGMFWKVIGVMCVSILLAGLIWAVTYSFNEWKTQSAFRDALRTTIHEAFKEAHDRYAPPKSTKSE